VRAGAVADVAAPLNAASTVSEKATAGAVDADEDKTGPAVRRLLTEHGLKASDVKAQSADGRLTTEDVQHHLKTMKAVPA
ncbi:E3 binding domain-containing protein, partial [Streptobacillus moniliformis]|uniref:E3 binding domain-containing protein n=1 Tax=Streptobacillus moniliformis TaxID=34105 RepID=UPI000A9CB2B5